MSAFPLIATVKDGVIDTNSLDPATGLIAHAYFKWFKSTEMDIPITRRGKIVSAVRIPPISKILSGNPLISPLNCSNAAKSTMIAAASMITKTAPNNMDRRLNSRCSAVGCLTAISSSCAISSLENLPLKRPKFELKKIPRCR